MREIVNSTYISLDGVIEKPETWPATGGFGPKGNQIQTDLVLACSAVLMGRRTYESFSEVWPTMSGNPLADKMNAMPKYVASTTLQDPAWNNTHVIKGDLAAEVKKLKEEPGGDIVQFGFGQVSHTLLASGLLDRLRLWVHPFLLGRGGAQDLLYRDTPETHVTLVDATALESGIVILDYRIRDNDSEHTRVTA
jgi:dihydrofolate reductase